MSANERADAILKDVLVNHLPRIKEGLEKGYADENQVLVVYDHLVRARILREHADRYKKDSALLDQMEAEKMGVGYNGEVCAWGADCDAPFANNIRQAIRNGLTTP